MNILETSLSSCLVSDGNLLALIEEERLSRNKDKETYGLSREWCEEIAYNITGERLLRENHSSVPEDASLGGPKTSGPNPFCGGQEEGEANSVHHLHHAVGAFAQSGFSEASILVMDGADGEETTSIVIFKATTSGLEEVIRYGVEHSLGRMIHLAATFCGLQKGRACGAGKLMGLATYCTTDFSVITSKYLDVNPYTGEVNKHSIPIDYFEEFLSRKLKLEPSKDFSFRYVKAAGLAQHLFEASVWSLLWFVKNTLPSKNLIITGGCALNCTMNGKILRSKAWDKVFIPPLCEDAGNILGQAILQGKLTLKKPVVYNTMKYSIPKGINATKVSFSEVAALLSSGEVVAWFEGGSEYGPRALCHRSLLADPRYPWIKYLLNEIKRREYWRPFAPVILDTFFTKVFEVDAISSPHRYMLATEVIRPEYRGVYPSIVAPDGTARPQVLECVPENKVLYELMSTYKLPVLVNTSLNGANMPICETIEDAHRFLWYKPVKFVFVKGKDLFLLDNFLATGNKTIKREGWRENNTI